MPFSIILNETISNLRRLDVHFHSIVTVVKRQHPDERNLDVEPRISRNQLRRMNIEEAIQQAKSWNILSNPSVQVSIMRAAILLSSSRGGDPLFKASNVINTYMNLKSCLHHHLSPSVGDELIIYLVRHKHLYPAIVWLSQQTHTTSSLSEILSVMSMHHEQKAEILQLLYDYIVNAKTTLMTRNQLINFIKASARYRDSRNLFVITQCLDIPILKTLGSASIPVPHVNLKKCIPGNLINNAVVKELVQAYNAVAMYDVANLISEYWISTYTIHSESETKSYSINIPLSFIALPPQSRGPNTRNPLLHVVTHPSIASIPPQAISSRIMGQIAILDSHYQHLPYTNTNDMTRSVGLWPYASRKPWFARNVVAKAVSKGVVQLSSEIDKVENAVELLAEWVHAAGKVQDASLYTANAGNASSSRKLLERELVDPLGVVLNV